MTERFTKTLTLNKRIRTVDGRRVNAPIDCRVWMSIEIDALFRELGQRALNSKGKRATMNNGNIKVEVRAIETEL